MGMKNDSRSEEVKKAIEAVLGRSSDSGENQAQKVLEILQREKVLSRYHNEDVVGLLASVGRVLSVIVDDPKITQRAIAVYLDLSETMVDRSIKALVSAGLITKTKVNRQNIYKINAKAVLEHPDIQHFSLAINKLSSANEQAEDEPF